MAKKPKIAVLVPCYNEELTIAEVVKGFAKALPNADIYVFDNDSSDNTSKVAKEAGAIVMHENRRGKGYVVSSMFMNVDADCYIMIDGDATYSPEEVDKLIEPVLSGDFDMVVGDRLTLSENHDVFRPFHLFGNRLVATAVNLCFGSNLQDIMSGYRCFSRRLVKSLPLISRGFEIETQMSVQALYYNLKIKEIPIKYTARVENSSSKLSTFRDGAKVLLTIFNALKAYRPLAFFSLFSLFPSLFALVLLLGIVKSVYTGPVVVGLLLCSMVLLCSGLVLDAMNHRVRELGQLVLLRSQDAD